MVKRIYVDVLDFREVSPEKLIPIVKSKARSI